MSIQPYEPHTGTDDWVPVVAAVGDLASKVSNSAFVPKALRGKVPEVAACILFGREIGLKPMQALNEINVIEGSVSLSSTAMRSLVFSAGHRIQVDDWTDHHCTLSGYRRGDTEPAATVTFTMNDAQRAGLHQRGPWKQHPRSMLLARATSELCRAVFPDVIGGLQLADDAISNTDQPTTAGQVRRRPIPPLPEQRNGQPQPLPAGTTGPDQPPREDPTPPIPSEAAGQEAPPLEAEDIPAPPTTRQMRMLHALLRGAGHTTDDAVHAALSRALGRDITSRKELTREEVGRLLDQPEQLKQPPNNHEGAS